MPEASQTFEVLNSKKGVFKVRENVATEKNYNLAKLKEKKARCDAEAARLDSLIAEAVKLGLK